MTRPIDPKARRQQDERDARMARILDAALDLAVREGLESVTTPRLAKELGYTVGAFYRYWPSVDGLLAALHQRTAELFYDAYWAALIPARAALDEIAKRRAPRVRALAALVLLPRLYRRIAARHPARFELVGQLLTHRWKWIDEAAQARLDVIVLPRVQEIVSITLAAQEAGAIDRGDPVARTMSIWIAAHATLALRPLAERHRHLVDIDGILETTIRSLLLGFGAARADLDLAVELADQALARTGQDAPM